MDPLTVTVGCVSLLSTVSTLSKNLDSFVSTTQQASSDLKAFKQDITSLSSVLYEIRRLDDKKALPEKCSSELLKVLEQCGEVIVKMNTLLSKLSSESLGRRMQWSIASKSEAEGLRTTLSSYKATLLLILSSIGVSISQDILDDTSYMREHVALLPSMYHKIEAMESYFQSRQKDHLEVEIRSWNDITTCTESISEDASTTYQEQVIPSSAAIASRDMSSTSSAQVTRRPVPSGSRSTSVVSTTQSWTSRPDQTTRQDQFLETKNNGTSERSSRGTCDEPRMQRPDLTLFRSLQDGTARRHCVDQETMQTIFGGKRPQLREWEWVSAINTAARNSELRDESQCTLGRTFGRFLGDKSERAVWKTRSLLEKRWKLGVGDATLLIKLIVKDAPEACLALIDSKEPGPCPINWARDGPEILQHALHSHDDNIIYAVLGSMPKNANPPGVMVTAIRCGHVEIARALLLIGVTTSNVTANDAWLGSCRLVWLLFGMATITSFFSQFRERLLLRLGLQEIALSAEWNASYNDREREDLIKSRRRFWFKGTVRDFVYMVEPVRRLYENKLRNLMDLESLPWETMICREANAEVRECSFQVRRLMHAYACLPDSHLRIPCWLKRDEEFWSRPEPDDDDNEDDRSEEDEDVDDGEYFSEDDDDDDDYHTDDA